MAGGLEIFVGSNGRLRRVDPPVTGTFSAQGFRVNADGRLYMDLTGPCVYVHNGIPFTADGAVCASGASPVRFAYGLPFSSQARICVSGNAAGIAYYDQGLGFSSSGQIITTTN